MQHLNKHPVNILTSDMYVCVDVYVSGSVCVFVCVFVCVCVWEREREKERERDQHLGPALGEQSQSLPPLSKVCGFCTPCVFVSDRRGQPTIRDVDFGDG